MKNELINPYANALDGLDIKDPVYDFLIFVRKEKKLEKGGKKMSLFHGQMI